MKKVILIIVLLLVLSPLFAWKELDFASANHTIIGYINGVLELSVSNFYYASANEGKGLSLNINDDANNHRFLIAPTHTPKSVAVDREFLPDFIKFGLSTYLIA